MSSVHRVRHQAWRATICCHRSSRARHHVREAHRLRFAERHAEDLGDRRGTARCHTMHVAVGDVERLFRAAGFFGRPEDRARQQIGVGCLSDTRRATGKPQRFAAFALHGGQNAERADHVHRAAERKTADDLRPHDRVGPSPRRAQLRPGGLPDSSRSSRRGGAVRARDPECASARGARRTPSCLAAASRGAATAGCPSTSSALTNIAVFDGDLFRIAPAGDELRLFVQRRVDDVS